MMTTEERAVADGQTGFLGCEAIKLTERSLMTPALLGHGNDGSTDRSDRFASSIVDALSAHVAILDETGTIIAVNRASRAFAEANPPIASNVFEGANYLRVCETADGPNADQAAAIAGGIRDVMSGREQDFALEYPCHSAEEERWFIARVTRFRGEGPMRVVVAHENITARRRAENDLEKRAHLAELTAEVTVTLTQNIPLSDSLQRTAESLVRHLDAAFARIWTINSTGDVLELQASAGMYTHIDGPHGRVPVGQSKIGLIARTPPPPDQRRHRRSPRR